jgi:uncharacterized YigZ family protein
MNSNSVDAFKTIKAASMAELKEKGSRFIAYAYPIESEDEVKPLLEILKKEHFKAVHHCFAYKIGLDNDTFRANDDGEPSGSAGKPILNVILSKNLTNILIVVVRYFGGTLLGVPGLINAYKSASSDALDEAEIIDKTIDETIKIAFDFAQMNAVMKVMKEFQIKIIEQGYEDNQCTLSYSIRQSLAATVAIKIQKEMDGF